MQSTYSSHVKLCQPSCPAQQMEIQIYIQIQQVPSSLDGMTGPTLTLRIVMMMMMIKNCIIMSCIQICPQYKGSQNSTKSQCSTIQLYNLMYVTSELKGAICKNWDGTGRGYLVTQYTQIIMSKLLVLHSPMIILVLVS